MTSNHCHVGIFMDQSAITLAHIDSDGIHLNFHGNAILKFNLLSLFSTFDPNCMNCRNDFDEACC